MISNLAVFHYCGIVILLYSSIVISIHGLNMFGSIQNTVPNRSMIGFLCINLYSSCLLLFDDVCLDYISYVIVCRHSCTIAVIYLFLHTPYTVYSKINFFMCYTVYIIHLYINTNVHFPSYVFFTRITWYILLRALLLVYMSSLLLISVSQFFYYFLYDFPIVLNFKYIAVLP